MAGKFCFVWIFQQSNLLSLRPICHIIAEKRKSPVQLPSWIWNFNATEARREGQYEWSAFSFIFCFVFFFFFLLKIKGSPLCRLNQAFQENSKTLMQNLSLHVLLRPTFLFCFASCQNWEVTGQNPSVCLPSCTLLDVSQGQVDRVKFFWPKVHGLGLVGVEDNRKNDTSFR